jgi:hypothetical protein
MTKTAVALVCLLGACTPAAHEPHTYYVSARGEDSNPGTREHPFLSLERAIERVAPGDTVLVEGGAYTPPRTITLEKSGSEQYVIRLWAIPGEQPVLDFSHLLDSDPGIRLSGSFWHLKGLVIEKAPDKGIHVSGANNIIERTVTRANGDGGIKLDTGASNNLILNCDSYLNYDKATKGGNADGFAAKHGLGEGNAFKGCRAWNNSDDGFDFMEAGTAVRVERSWSWGNGQNVWKDPGFDGNGVGYKLGDGPGEHVIVRCLAWGNGTSGFNIQGNSSRVTLHNNTAWNNGRNYLFDDENPHHLRNNVSLQGEVVMWEGIDHQSNSWNAEFLVTREDFLSLEDVAMESARGADGTLPESDFLELAPRSALIDAGVDVGLPYVGKAPDLGAFETTRATAHDAE